jgi:hypothetical protein
MVVFITKGPPWDRSSPAAPSRHSLALCLRRRQELPTSCHSCRSSASIISFETVCIFVQMAYSLSKSKLTYSRCSEVVGNAATIPRLHAIRSCAAPGHLCLSFTAQKNAFRRVIRSTGAPTLHFRACADAYFCYECTGL